MHEFFEWDEKKAASNLVQHGISFDEARLVFLDPYEQTIASDRGLETRFLTIGKAGLRVISVAWTLRPETTRIISARSSRRGERRKYRPLQ